MKPSDVAGNGGLRRSLVMLVALAAAWAFGAAAVARAQESAQQTTLYSIALIDLLPDQAEPGAALLNRYMEQARQEPGLLRLDLVQETQPLANHYALLAVWRTAEDRRAHVERASTKQFREDLQPLLASPVDERIYMEPSR